MAVFEFNTWVVNNLISGVKNGKFSQLFFSLPFPSISRRQASFLSRPYPTCPLPSFWAIVAVGP